MSVNAYRQKGLCLLAMVAASVAGGVSSVALAQVQDAADPNIIVNGERLPDVAEMTKGPDIKGVITARSADKIKVTGPDGSSTLIFFNESTKVQASSGLFGGSGKLGVDSVLNGLPVTVKTLQAGTSLLASQITFKKGDLKTATMIRHGTAQGFAEQTAATEALRGRMADIDKYNVKSTMNVYFDTGKAKLSPEAKAELCQVASTADGMSNALMLVVGYTDAVGDEEYNQVLSEKRAASVINYLQQACRWKPYRMLTPTGMAEADPVADNETYEGKAQNRRVAVNVLVSKGLDGM